MQDFWEMMGRLVTDSEFRQELSQIPNTTYQLNTVQRAMIPPATGSGITGDDYGMLRAIVHPYMPDTPLSLMGLGEMLWSLTSQEFRDKAKAVAQGIEKMDITIDDFEDEKSLIALGALITDQNLIPELTTYHHWRKLGFGWVPRRDRKLIEKIFGGLAGPIHSFCVTLWGNECNDSVIEWPLHTHPVAM